MIFYALDVETANPDYSSICQIGIAKFEDTNIIEKYVTLVNPEDYFDLFNVSIHGITEDMVKDAPIFKDLYNKLNNMLKNQIVVHHGPFDKGAFSRVCEKYNMPVIEAKWLDTVKIARRTWEEFSNSGYGLANIAQELKIKFKHHDALEDAIVAGLILNKAIEKANLSLEDWFLRVEKPIHIPTQSYSKSLTSNEVNYDGKLFGETIVFTGELSIPRKEAAKLAAQAGCVIANSVTKNVTILVVGQQDLRKVGEIGKSSKQIKAEELITKGQNIMIIGENDFYKIIE